MKYINNIGIHIAWKGSNLKLINIKDDKSLQMSIFESDSLFMIKNLGT